MISTLAGARFSDTPSDSLWIHQFSHIGKQEGGAREIPPPQPTNQPTNQPKGTKEKKTSYHTQW